MADTLRKNYSMRALGDKLIVQLKDGSAWLNSPGDDLAERAEEIINHRDFYNAKEIVIKTRRKSDRQFVEVPVTEEELFDFDNWKITNYSNKDTYYFETPAFRKARLS